MFCCIFLHSGWVSLAVYSLRSRTTVSRLSWFSAKCRRNVALAGENLPVLLTVVLISRCVSEQFKGLHNKLFKVLCVYIYSSYKCGLYNNEMYTLQWLISALAFSTLQQTCSSLVHIKPSWGTPSFCWPKPTPTCVLARQNWNGDNRSLSQWSVLWQLSIHTSNLTPRGTTRVNTISS